MKRLFSLITVLAATAAPALAADIGVSIGISQPGVYGRIDIGRVASPPVLVYEQPMVIVPGPVAVQRRPIYLHVPPGHARDWRRYCGRYQACGQPVYFVQDNWYRDTYVPRYRADQGRPGRREDRQHAYRDGYRDAQRDDHPGKGHGRGQGKPDKHDKAHHGRD